jgi:hypothetical protein
VVSGFVFWALMTSVFPRSYCVVVIPGALATERYFLSESFLFQQGVVEVAFAQKDRREIIVWEFAR